MSRGWKSEISSIKDVDITWNEPLSKYTTFKVGGIITCIIYPKSKEALSKTIDVLKGACVPYFVLGKGSNLLVADDLPEMVAISLKRASVEAESTEAGGRVQVRAGAGIALSKLMRICLNQGLTGLEFLVGIPGSLGGAVMMNAGTKHGEISDVLEHVTMMTEKGEVRITRMNIKFSYRKTHLPVEGVVWDATLHTEKEEKKIVRKRMLDILRERKIRQPEPTRTAGSVFKNPPGDYAGRLIEQAGLKGKVLGGAKISEKHANWIVTTHGAKASDVYGLLKLVQNTVEDKLGIKLEPEIKLIGFE